MRHLRPAPAILMALSAVLTGCAWHDHSKDSAKACVHETGSFLCENPDVSDNNVAGGSDPSVQLHTVTPHD